MNRCKRTYVKTSYPAAHEDTKYLTAANKCHPVNVCWLNHELVTTYTWICGVFYNRSAAVSRVGYTRLLCLSCEVLNYVYTDCETGCLTQPRNTNNKAIRRLFRDRPKFLARTSYSNAGWRHCMYPAIDGYKPTNYVSIDQHFGSAATMSNVDAQHTGDLATRDK